MNSLFLFFHCSDGSVYSHGQPTNKSYMIDLTTVQPRLYIVASAVNIGDGVDRVSFLATDRSVTNGQFCGFGPIGGDGGDVAILFGVANAFYGNAGVGLNSLGYFGCLQVPID